MLLELFFVFFCLCFLVRPSDGCGAPGVSNTVLLCLSLSLCQCGAPGVTGAAECARAAQQGRGVYWTGLRRERQKVLENLLGGKLIMKPGLLIEAIHQYWTKPRQLRVSMPKPEIS